MKKPNIVQTVLSVAACKFTRFFLRKTGRGGTAVPGIVAMKFSKNILARVTEGMEIVAVTGTNGKTTTCNMIRHALLENGRDCLENNAGANLLHGITSDLVSNSTAAGKPKYHYAVLEVDEAVLKLLVPLVNPKVIVTTSLFSDQVDRYGSVQNTLKEIKAGVDASPDPVLVINADEPLTASLAVGAPNRVIRYGLSKNVGIVGNIDLSDAGKCPVCGGDYSYEYHTYAHLGGFYCHSCGYGRKTPDVQVMSVSKMDTSGSDVKVNIDGYLKNVRVSLPALYNIYNASACIGAVKALGIPEQEAIDSLKTVSPAFGRMETFDLSGLRVQMILVKNPAGCNQAFSYVTGFDEDYTAVLCLNNRTGDGHDFSWIEQTDYEKLCADPHLKKIYVCGDRMDDLYDRLLRAGASEEIMEKTSDYKAIVEKLKEEGRSVFLLPNYTAMMELRAAVTAETGNKEFWE